MRSNSAAHPEPLQQRSLCHPSSRRPGGRETLGRKIHMSDLLLQHAERRWQRFILVPLNIAFIAGAGVSIWNGRWLFAGAFAFLVLYIGSVGARLTIHRGKNFKELSRGITPELPDLSSTEGEFSESEMWRLTDTMVRTLYAVILAAVVIGFIVEWRWYWCLLAGLVVWLVGQPLGALAVALASHNPKDLGGNHAP
jgi:hypothetical protein